MGYSIIPINIDKHYDSILNLWKNNLSTSSAERFDWFYNKNPYGSPVTNLAILDESLVVGSGSLYPRKFYINGNVYLVGVAANFAVDKAHRLFGASLQIQRSLCNSFDSTFCFKISYPNKSSKGLFTRVGYKEVGSTEDWIKLFSCENKIAKYIKNKLSLFVVSNVVDGLLYLYDKLLFFKLNNKYETETINMCDDRFDSLWKDASVNYKCIGEKTSSYLNWRYTYNENCDYKYFCILDKKYKNLVGYVVYSELNDHVIVSELFAKPENLFQLVLLFIKEMRLTGIRSILISYFGTDMFTDILKDLKFIKRPDIRNIFAWFDSSKSSEFTNIIFEKNNWFIFDADVDI